MAVGAWHVVFMQPGSSQGTRHLGRHDVAQPDGFGPNSITREDVPDLACRVGCMWLVSRLPCEPKSPLIVRGERLRCGI